MKPAIARDEAQRLGRELDQTLEAHLVFAAQPPGLQRQPLIARDQDLTDLPAILHPDRIGPALHRNLLALARDEPEPRMSFLAFLWRNLPQRKHFVQASPPCRLLADATQTLGLAIQKEDAALSVGRDDRITDARKRHREQLAIRLGPGAHAAKPLAEHADQHAIDDQ